MDDEESLDKIKKAQVGKIRDRVKIRRAYKERSGGRNQPALPRKICGRMNDCHDDNTHNIYKMIRFFV